MESARTEVISELMEKYNLGLHRGFLPSSDPLLRLPNRFAAWENLADNFTAFINAGVIRDQIDELPLLQHLEFKSGAEWNRSMLLLSFFAHAYVHSAPKPVGHIPPQIAVPWIKVAKALGRKPILSHASIVLHNWRRLDPDKPVQLDNLATLVQFHGGLDESWFYLVTVEIEAVGAPAIPLILETMHFVQNEQYTKAAEYLEQSIPILQHLTTTLKKMYANCEPNIFYLRIRPFLGSFEDIEYQGTGLPPQNHHGGSAAQSSLLQFFDAALGIEYEHKSTSKYLRQMRQHMPGPHADFLAYAEKNTLIAKSISKNKQLNQAYKAAVKALIEFRNEHLKIVALYIMKPAKRSNTPAMGTGGTSPMAFLKSVRNQNEKIIK